MTDSKEQRRRITFGPFEADCWSQEVKKHGVRLRIAGQPFQVLRMLLERQGELVIREDLHKALWPSDTFVDFEHGLNAAVNKLRQVLSDEAEAPRYIETVPRRGYRFIAPVSAPAPKLAVETVGVKSQAFPARISKRNWCVAAFLGTLACALIVAAVIRLRSPSRVPRVLGYRQLTNDRVQKDAPFTDGIRVYFRESDSGLMQVSVQGGEIAKVPNSLSDFHPSDLSADRTKLAGTSGDGLWGERGCSCF